MQIVHYGHAQLRTADSIALALVDCAEALATSARFAVVEIPTATVDGTGSARLLIGPGIPVISVSTPDRSSHDGGLDSELAQLDVHRSVRSLRDTATGARTPAHSSALAIDGGMLDEFWQYMQGDDLSETPDQGAPSGRS